MLENTLNFIENDYFEFLERFQDNKLLLSKGLINGNEIIDAYYIINANILENTLSFQLSSDNSLIYNSFLLDIDNNSYYLYSDKSYFIIGMIDDFIISLEEIDKERHLKYIDFINNETFIIPGYELINEIINYETINSNMIVFETEDFYDVINLKERVVRRVITEDGQIFCVEDGIYLKQKNYLYKIDL